MAIFEVMTEKNKDTMQLFRKLNYITDWRSTCQALIYGSAVSTFNPYDEMITVKEVFDKTERSAYKHYVLSIEKNEMMPLFEFKDLGIEVCELISGFYGNYQVLMAVHTDTDNLHVHYVANTIDYITGERIDLNRKRLDELKQHISKILYKFDLSPVRMRQSSTVE